MKIKSLNVRNEAKKFVTKENVIFEVKAKNIYDTSFKSANKKIKNSLRKKRYNPKNITK